MNIRHILRLKTCSLLLQFIAERYLSISCKKVKVEMHGPVPQAWHYPHMAPSFGPLPFFHILVSLWMVSGDLDGG